MPHICHLQNSIICIFPESSSEDVFDEQSSLLSSILGKKKWKDFMNFRELFIHKFVHFFIILLLCT